ncbi:methyltransferase domain-containing protein [Bacillus cereus]
MEVGIRCNIWRNKGQRNDLSSTQIEIANKTLKEWNPKLVCGAMEEEGDIPKGYFDIVYSIYALGWTLDLRKTLELIYSYVKPGGSFIFSWEHPVYSNLQYGTEEVAIKSSYHKETPITFETFKGENVQATLYKRKISTYINELNRAGFKIERIEDVFSRAKIQRSATQNTEVSNLTWSL